MTQPDSGVTIRDALAGAARRLTQAGVDEAAREAYWLLASVMEVSGGSLRLRGAELLTPAVFGRFNQLVERRAGREPVQYVLGTEEFMGMEFRVTPAVLIPRLDTETLVRASVDLIQAGRLAEPLLADIGTGSGAIAVALARELPGATVMATDISLAALAVARENAQRNGMADRIDFRPGDLLEPLQGQLLDAIVSNPPYIPEKQWTELMPEVRDWEPKLALSPGPDGLVIYRRLAAEGLPLLRPGGFLAVEVGFDQAASVCDIFRQVGLTVATHRDGQGIERVVTGRLV